MEGSSFDCYSIFLRSKEYYEQTRSFKPYIPKINMHISILVYGHKKIQKN